MMKEGPMDRKKKLRPRRRENRLNYKNIRRNNSTNFPKFDKRHGCRFKKLGKSPKWYIHKESWALKNQCFQTVVLEKTLEGPLDSKEIKPVNPKGNQPWIFIGRTDAEVPILWPPDSKSWLIGKDPDVGKDWGQEDKGVTEDEIIRWHHPLNGHEFEQTPGDGKGQERLACCSPWAHKELDRT